ncbi:hypothetical protein N7495_004666 [Penicillium taxi]|uniref:uncharacterized protein n=1 Tax=Penicillium taxi TaxID=168475 RepID=UPI0025455C96|nr:uncharacterized protein N7495_004666 [Penicillium taxi]KAJ5899922.1 hypothetical protein N7495_004666 [Penicillium taxi]
MNPYPMPLSPTPSIRGAPAGPVPGTAAGGPGPGPADGFRPRRSDDWHEYREIIEQLYRNDQLKLRDVKRIMEREYKFFASYHTTFFTSLEKQYKDRLAAWNVRKNIKAKQVQLMVRKQEKRAARGKQTAFRMNGQEVDKKRIARFSRRYHDAWEKDRVKKKDAKQSSPEPATPSDMTCYTPERDVSTPISPTEVSPSREAPYPLTYETIPDFVMDEDSPYHMSASNQSSRPTYHRSNSVAHPGQHSHSHSQHPQVQQHPIQVHQHPHSLQHQVQHPVHHQQHPHPHQHQHPNYPVSVSAATTPVATQLLPPVPILNPSHRVDVDAPGEIVTHPDDWNRLDAFQDRLQHLQYTLNQSMSKWARDQDSNQEISHHEGLGL